MDSLKLQPPKKNSKKNNLYYCNILLPNDNICKIFTEKCTVLDNKLHLGEETKKQIILLEKQVKKEILLNSSEWFSNDMAEDDIELFFRKNQGFVNLENLEFNQYTFSIYDHTGAEVQCKRIDDGTTVLAIIVAPILEFTSDYFQIKYLGIFYLRLF